MFTRLILLFIGVVVILGAPTTTSIEPTPTPSTIVDILSSNVEFSYFLRVLQRTGLIPVINQLQNVTLLAPVNLAFTNNDLQGTMAHELMRYVINQKVRVGWMDSKSVVYDSLYEINGKPYPILISPNLEDQVFEVDNVATIVDSDIYAKHQWSFIQGIDAQLPLKPSMCDVLMAPPTGEDDDIKFIKLLFQLLFHTWEEEANKFTITKRHKKKKKKYPKLPASCEEYLNGTSTFFIPDDETIRSSMSNMTIRYYSALYHSLKGNRFTSTDESILEIKHDIIGLLDNLMFPDLITPSNISKSHYKSINHLKYSLTSENNSIIINDKITAKHMMSTSDGIFHIFNNDNFFQNSNVELIEIVPRKALFAMHYSNFVSELEFRSLDYLIDGSTGNQTILLSLDQRDDVEDSSNGVFSRGIALDEGAHSESFSSQQTLKYQVINERINITDQLGNDTLYKLSTTNLCVPKKIDGCFKIKISASMNPLQARINDEIKIKSEPFAIGNDSIAYVVDRSVEPPLNLKHSLSDLLSSGDIHRHLEHIKIDQQECLKTIQYLIDFGLLSLHDNKQGYSAFLPCGKPIIEDNITDDSRFNGNWDSLGLILKYLERNPDIFQNLLKGIFIEGSIYSDFGLGDNKLQKFKTKTLRGDPITVTNKYFDGNYNHILQVNNTLVSLPLNSDILFNQGVVHIVSDLLLPADFEVSFIDLVKATEEDGVSFLNIIEKIPFMNDVLFKNNQFSLLVPTPESMNIYNITSSMSNLLEFLKMHLIPNSELPKIFDCMSGIIPPDGDNEEGSINTGYLIDSNHTNLKFNCKRTTNKKTVLDTTDKSGSKLSHKLKILSYGCVKASHDAPCVFLIDKPLNPSWLDTGFLHIHLGFVSVGIGIILGLVLFSFMIFVIMFCLSGSTDDKDTIPSNPFETDNTSSFMHIGTISDTGMFDRGYETDDDNENTPLADQRLYGSIEQQRGPPKPVSIKQRDNLHRVRNIPM